MNNNTSIKKLITLAAIFTFLCVATGCSMGRTDTATDATTEESMTTTEERDTQPIDDLSTDRNTDDSMTDQTESEGILGDLIDDVSDGVSEMTDDVKDKDPNINDTNSSINDNKSSIMDDTLVTE